MWAVVLAVSPSSWAGAETSVLNRVMTVEDPGLAECLRVAVENIPAPTTTAAVPAYERQRLETIKTVTESYAQIRLFDAQIEEVDKRLRTSPLPDGLSYELVTARAELQMKRTTELARLRLAMGVLPRYAFAQRPADQLKDWILLDVPDPNHVCVLRYQKPFQDYFPGSTDLVTVLSGKQVDRYVSEVLLGRQNLPLRVTISRTTEGFDYAAEVYDRVVRASARAGVETEADVRLEAGVHGLGAGELYAMHDGGVGKVGYGRPQYVNRRAGSAVVRQLVGLLDPNHIDAAVRDDLAGTRWFPARWIIRHDLQSKDLAVGIAAVIRKTASSLGLSQLVEVETKEVSDGRWD
ncbi:MAG: hypothetical protein KBE04_13040 [Phycisphaerae bacterium]|nr:hypothetical protein [Phycisphaerae bacterium]